jgi:hypothetical protein
MIHIVFNQDDISVLRAAIEMDETLQGEVIQIKDDFAVGPIDNLYSSEGIEERKQWWANVLEGGDYQHLIHDTSIDDNKTVQQLIEKLNEDADEVLWIWAAQNAHDVCGYYWLISQLKDYTGRVMILYLNNLPFINEKGNIFYPTTLSSILPKEFLKAKKLARPITASEFEVDPDEWIKLSTSAGLRQLEGGKKLGHEGYHFFDAEILKFITSDWQKANKVIHQFLSKSKFTTGDAYLLWRLKEMISAEKIEVQGKVGQMKEFEVKLKGSNENVNPA